MSSSRRNVMRILKNTGPLILLSTEPALAKLRFKLWRQQQLTHVPIHTNYVHNIHVEPSSTPPPSSPQEHGHSCCGVWFGANYLNNECNTLTVSTQTLFIWSANESRQGLCSAPCRGGVVVAVREVGGWEGWGTGLISAFYESNDISMLSKIESKTSERRNERERHWGKV